MSTPILTAIIVDDEPTARYGLRSYINKTHSLKCVGEFSDVGSLEAYLNLNVAPDIIFLDIQMPEVSGIDFLESKAIDSTFIIVTAYEEYALKGFDLNVCDYLLKPVSYKRFMQAVDKASEHVYYRHGLVEDNFVFLRADRMIHRVAISDIEYLESMENYVNVITTEEKFVTRSTFKEMLELLLTKGIIQVHKSYAVNLGRIKKIEGSHIVTDGRHILPLSRTYRDSLMMSIEKQMQKAQH